MTAPSHKTFRFHLLALLIVAIWGVTFVCTKVLIGAGMAPAAIFFCRFVLAYAGIWVYTLIDITSSMVLSSFSKVSSCMHSTFFSIFRTTSASL